MRGRAWRRTLYPIGVVTGGLLFVFQVVRGYQEINYGLFHTAFFQAWGVAVSLVIMAFGLQMVAWSRLMRGLGTRLPWSEVIAGYTLSFLPRYIPGSVWGYLSRSQWLYQAHSVPYGLSNLGSLLEVIASVITAIMMIGIYAISITSELSQVTLALVIFSLPFAAWLLLRWVGRVSFIARLVTDKSGKISLLGISLTDWVVVVFLYLLLWACYGTSILVLIQAFNLPDRGSLTTATFAFSASWLAGFLVIFVPAGLGVRELVLASLMATGFDLLASQASGVAVVSRFTISLSEGVWVLLGIILTQLEKRRSRDAS